MPELKRNTPDSLLRVGAGNLPRTKHVFPTLTHTTSARHGDIFPFFCMPVYPNQSLKVDSNWFAKSDISSRVPLDDINFDIYYFYVPYRLIDRNFPKILGDKDPYDSSSYSMKTFKLTGMYASGGRTFDPNFLPFYLRWSTGSTAYYPSSGGGDWDKLTAYPIAVYWQIINDYFRDESIDPIMDFDSAFYGVDIDMDTLLADTTRMNKQLDPSNSNRYLYPMVANKLSDLMTRGLVTPQLGDAIKIPAASFAWLDTSSDLKDTTGFASLGLGDGSIISDAVGLGIDEDGKLSYVVNGDFEDNSNDGNIKSTNLGIKLKDELGTIQELQLAFNIQGYRARQRLYGTRYIEQIHGLFGIDLPDVMVGRAEYLGGTMTSFNNIPILSTEASSLGVSAGNSSTLFNDGGFFKSFGEWGLVMGVAVARVHHRYSQGKDNTLWSVFDELDLYNPAFANLGPEGNKRSNMYNLGHVDENTIFNYIESNSYLRQSLDHVSGVFNPNTSSKWDEFRTLWSYADYYIQTPSYNATWLKEDYLNVARTMSGRLIAGAPLASGDTGYVMGAPQYLFSIYTHIESTLPLPAHPNPDYLFGRL